MNAKGVGLIPETTRIDDEGQFGAALDRLLNQPGSRCGAGRTDIQSKYRDEHPPHKLPLPHTGDRLLGGLRSRRRDRGRLQCPDDIGRQAAEWVNEMSDFAQLAGQMREPRYFRIAVNDRVSQALGLETRDAEALPKRSDPRSDDLEEDHRFAFDPQAPAARQPGARRTDWPAGFGIFFVVNASRTLDESLRDQGLSIAGFLAPASEYGTISGNRDSLMVLLQATLAQHPVRGAAVLDQSGHTLAISGP